MDFRHIFLMASMMRSYVSDSACDVSNISNSIIHVQQQLKETQRSTDDVISRLNDLKTRTEQQLLGLSSSVDSIKSHLFNLLVKSKNTTQTEMALCGHLKSFQQSMKQIKKEQFNIKNIINTAFQSSQAILQINQNYLKTSIQNIEELKKVIYETLDRGRNNAWKLDSIEKSSQMVGDNILRMDKTMNDAEEAGIATKGHLKEIKKGTEVCPDWVDSVWKTSHLLYILIPLVTLAVMLVGVNGFLVKMVLKKKDEKTASYESNRPSYESNRPSYESIGPISSTWPTGPRVPNRAHRGSDASDNQRLLDFESEDTRESDNMAFGDRELGVNIPDTDMATEEKFGIPTGNNFLSSDFIRTDLRRELPGNIQHAYSEPLIKGKECQPNLFPEYDNSSNCKSLPKAYEQRNGPLLAPNTGRSISANNNFSAMGNANRTSSDVQFRSWYESLQQPTSSQPMYTREEQRRDGCSMKDCPGTTEDETQRDEQSQRRTAEEHTYTGLVPQVMWDIVGEMPPGMTAEDILRTCVDDKPIENQSNDDEDSEESSDYVKGRISSSSK